MQEKKQKDKLIVFRGTHDLLRRIKAAAQKENRTVSNWIETLILRELDRTEGKK
jgi:hypothetical protein